MKKGADKLKERIAAAANMPRDVVLGDSVVTVIGNEEITRKQIADCVLSK